MAEEEIPRSEVADERGTVLAPTKNSPINKIDAYAMYMRYIPISEIAKAIGCTSQALSQMISNAGWKEEREALQKDVKKAVKAQALSRLTSITNNGLVIIDASIKSALRIYKDTQKAPSITEAEIVYKIVAGCHKLRITEQAGGASDEVMAMSPDAVLEAFMEDPYMRKAFSQDKIDDLNGEVIEINAADEDSISPRNSERSASQEARALAQKTE